MQTGLVKRKNPSRETCEQVIRRILSTEILENGNNTHFKQASDFMSYFESLYPASDSLTKQVQRAIKAMNMPKDAQGYYIPNKTELQLEQEDTLRKLFLQSEAFVDNMEDCEPLFLKLDRNCLDYAIHLIDNCETFRGKYTAIVKSGNGLIFYTRDKKQLEILLENLK